MQHEYTKENAEALLGLLHNHVDSLELLIDDKVRMIAGEQGRSVLTKMLADGGFPATEADDVRKALAALQAAVCELHMSMCMEFSEAGIDLNVDNSDLLN